ncbi:MAG TPA: cell division ATPase MinD [Candidatus Nanoarchaeia archaeon]|nr:cell division ATPase MinD [Candidatus Nanoarchaeia archaeon]
MKKIIVISSGKGGVGKTTTAVNLGAAMNHFGKDVVIVDGNLSTPNIGIHLNSPEVPISLNDVLKKRAELNEAIYQHHSGLKIIPSSLSIKELKKTKLKRLKELKKELNKLSEHIIIDSAAGLGEEAISAIEMADELILVTNPEMPAITDALKTIKLAEQQKIPVTGVIVTRVRQDKIELQPETVKEMLEVPVMGMIPEDITIKKAVNEKNSVIHTHPRSKPARAYKEIAARLFDIEYDSRKERPSFLKRIFKKEK